MHQLSPANEQTHERVLRILATGRFDTVLKGIGNALGVHGLAVYHVSFHGVSHIEQLGESSSMQHAKQQHTHVTETGGGVYKLIIPLLLEENAPPELILWDDNGDETWRGMLRYSVGTGVALGDDAVHGMSDCDYRNRTNNARHGGIENEDGEKEEERAGMRLVAVVHVGEVYDDIARRVVEETLAAGVVFPPTMDPEWLVAQEARHWQGENSGYLLENAMAGDAGRRAFRKGDSLEDCEERAEGGMCEIDVEGTRNMCPFSCEVYVREGPTRITRVDDARVDVCVRNRTGMEECRVYEDDATVAGDFVVPHLHPGEIFPIVWRDEEAKQTTDFAFQIGVPPELASALLKYADLLGITESLRELTGDEPLPVDPNGGFYQDFIEMEDENDWYVKRPSQKWGGNVHHISPGDEATHEDYLEVLGLGNFDVVLDAIGKYLGLEGLAAYHLTFTGVSHSERADMYRIAHRTGGSVYQLTVPLILDEDASAPELAIADRDDESRVGTLKYKMGTATMMGDDAMHGAEACDYRATGGMRLAATVFVADIHEDNSHKIAKQTLTQIFPPSYATWLEAQAGRHWVADGDDGARGGEKSLVNDEGRKHISFVEQHDCPERAEEGMCLTDIEYTRVKCLRSCNIFEFDLGDEEEESLPEFDFDFETYVVGSSIDAFFDGLDENDDDSCIDEDDTCKEKAENGLCMTHSDEMEELGCHRSCLYCLTSSSRDSFPLGMVHVTEEDDSDDEASEDEDPPSPRDVMEIMARMEHYFVNKVLKYDDLRAYRLSCRNTHEKCSVWAAEGYCESTPGEMGKTCSAACRNCPMVDMSVRCPANHETDIFQPGDINAMFERWLEEAGQDTSSFSEENFPRGGAHKFGELTVITSPYHDVMQYMDEEDDPETVSPIPWVVSIDGFLSDEECDRLIEHGAVKGYERSTQYSDTKNVDGSSKFIHTEGRTSSNTFCREGCYDDPIVAGVIERMTKMTSIPYDNFESLQLVKYELGQFYQRHHDFSILHDEHPYGPRILTFFLYLNDVEGGGGTKFDYLNFTAQPKKGMALVWPSMTDNLEEMDDWTWHEALPVLKGNKYGANTWIHLRDYQNTPNYCING